MNGHSSQNKVSIHSFNIVMAIAPLKIELVKSIRAKDKATFQGFRGDEIIKPTLINDIYSSHAHGSNPALIEMLRGYKRVK